MTAPAPSVSPELKVLLRRLRLGQLLDTLPERAALAKTHQLSHLQFSYGTACQAPRIACATADSGRGGPKARRTNRTEQSSGSPPG